MTVITPSVCDDQASESSSSSAERYLNRYRCPTCQIAWQDEWDTYMEAAKEADEWDFQNFVVANTTDRPADALQRLLPRFSSCPALFSRSFQMSLGNNGEVVTVAEV
jgi:hypothetical protein